MKNTEKKDKPATASKQSKPKNKMGETKRVRDIAARKQAEETLEQNRIWMENIFNALEEAILVVNPNRELININKAAERIFGYSLDELRKQSTEVLHVDHEHFLEFGQRINKEFEQGKTASFEFKARRKNGEVFPSEHTVALLKNEKGEKLGIVSVVRDITEHKHAEEKLRENEARLSEAQRINHLGSWELDLVTNHLIWSDEIYRIFEIDPQKFGASYEAFLNAIHPDDRKLVNKEYTTSVENHNLYSIEHRLLMPDARVKYVHEKGESFYDKDGRPLRSIGTVQDITERRRMEQQLHNERNFTNAILDNAGALVVVLDREGRIRRFNRAVEKLSGYNFAEIEGKFPWDTFLPAEDAETIRIQAFEALADNPKNTIGSYQNYWVSKNGERCLIDWTNTLLLDANGQMEFMISIGIDITERKRAEQTLQMSQEQSRAQYKGIPIPTYTYQHQGDDLVLIDYNTATETLTRGGIVNFLGKTLKETIGDRPDLIANISRCFNEKTSFSQEVSYRLQSTGEIGHFISTYVFVPPDLVMIHTEDITERKRAEEQIKASLQEKEVLLKEIHHRVKNNLQVISSLLYLQSRKTKTGELKNMFLEGQNRIASMTLIHEKLYQSADLAHISFADYARDLARALFNSFGVDQSQVALSVEANDLALDVDNAVPCGLIINEIISNSLKYAFPENRHGVIRITLDLDPENRFNLTISDDGVGPPTDFEMRSATSLGTRLIERLAEQIQGTVERSASSQGTSYRISFPHKL